MKPMPKSQGFPGHFTVVQCTIVKISRKQQQQKRQDKCELYSLEINAWVTPPGKDASSL